MALHEAELQWRLLAADATPLLDVMNFATWEPALAQLREDLPDAGLPCLHDAAHECSSIMRATQQQFVLLERHAAQLVSDLRMRIK